MGEGFAFQRLQDGVICSGGKAHKIPFDVGAYEAPVRHYAGRPEALVANHGAIDVAESDLVRSSAETRPTIAS